MLSRFKTYFILKYTAVKLKNKLKNLNFQVSILGDNAFIDLIDSNDELVKTYSIISKNVMLTKEEF